LAGARLSLVGRVAGPDTGEAVRRRFIARHPEAAGYAGFTDFSFRRFTVESGHLVAGFGRIVDLAPADILTDCRDADELAEVEESAVEHMNRDHGEALALYATRLLHLPAGDWRMTGIDPEGADLSDGEHGARLLFPERVTKAGRLRVVLADMARAARAAA
jgi:putative heme iron utilization protein